MSASSERERPDGAESSVANYDEETVNTALQRLAQRQQQRQYTAAKTAPLLQSSDRKPASPFRPQSSSQQRHRTHSWGGSDQGLQTNVEDFNSVSRGSTKDVRRESNNNEVSHKYSSKDDLDRYESNEHLHHESQHNNVNSRSVNNSRPPSGIRTADDTFNSFIEDSVINENEAASAYNAVTGVRPLSSQYRPSRGSQQYQLAAQQSRVQEQEEVSSAMREQSRAKHQAMIAQAHAAHQSQRNGQQEKDQEPVHVPKPPTKPHVVKKPASNHRLAR